MNPFFSIVIPTLNSGKTIKTALKSIFSQNFTGWEIVVIDGISTDNTVEVLKSFDQRKMKIICEKDDGIYDAMNKGMEAAKGEWIYFLGSDDRLYDENVLHQISIIKENKIADLIYGNVLIHGDSIWAKHGQMYDGFYSIDKLLRSNICHQAVFYRSISLRAIGGFNKSYPICADWDVNLHFFARYKVHYSSQVIAVFSSTGVSSAKAADAFLDQDYVKKVNMYFDRSLFNKSFTPWKRQLKKNAMACIKQRDFYTGSKYLLAYFYHSLK